MSGGCDDQSAALPPDLTVASGCDNPNTSETPPAAVPPSELPLLASPADGIPEPVVSTAGLLAVVEGLAAGTGPVAVDAERASGYRYSSRAYLVQLRRAGFGTALLDPIALPDLTAVSEAIDDAEWILHAAHQDLRCLAEVGLRPQRLFDTELAGRLLGHERVALGTMAENYLGIRLEKGHSAADWSTRPLPQSWLNYAALDVEVLIPLRDVLAKELDATGKREWAEQEFAAELTAVSPAPRAEPWRRTSGIHGIRSARQLAVVRALWRARDQFAASRDVAPGRVLPDSAVIAAAKALPTSLTELLRLPIYGGPRQRRHAHRWFEAITEASGLAPDQLPATTAPATDGPPAGSRWAERDPQAAARLLAARAVVAELSTEHQVLAQNVLASDVLRRLCWDPPQPTAPAVADRLRALGARPWQVGLVTSGLVEMLRKQEQQTQVTAAASVNNAIANSQDLR